MTQMSLFDYCAQCGTEHTPNPELDQEIHREQGKTQVYHFCCPQCRLNFAQRQFRENQTC